MSLEGKAEVVNEPAARSSTVGASGGRLVGLHRSSSSSDLGRDGFVEVHSQRSSASLRRTLSGRARNAKTWELYCDNIARNALPRGLETSDDDDGSALGAVGLLRSKSINALLPNLQPRHNLGVVSKEPVGYSRVAASLSKRPRLGRASSAISRLQSSTENVETQYGGKTENARSTNGRAKPNMREKELFAHTLGILTKRTGILCYNRRTY